MRTALFSVSYAGPWGQASQSLCEVIDKAASQDYDRVAASEMCSPLRGGGIANLDRCASRYLAWMRENRRRPAPPRSLT